METSPSPEVRSPQQVPCGHQALGGSGQMYNGVYLDHDGIRAFSQLWHPSGLHSLIFLYPALYNPNPPAATDAWFPFSGHHTAEIIVCALRIRESFNSFT